VPHVCVYDIGVGGFLFHTDWWGGVDGVYGE